MGAEVGVDGGNESISAIHAQIHGGGEFTATVEA